MVGSRSGRGLQGVFRFYSVYTIAAVGRGALASRERHTTPRRCVALAYVLGSGFPAPSVSQLDQTMAGTGGQRDPFALSLVARLHLLAGAQLIRLPLQRTRSQCPRPALPWLSPKNACRAIPVSTCVRSAQPVRGSIQHLSRVYRERRRMADPS